MKIYFLYFILLIHLTKLQDPYETLIHENVTEEYCKEVISNIKSLLEEVYIYTDFLKAPKQPEGYSDYIKKVDLIDELNKIETNDTNFYDFYRKIQNVIAKAKDGHLNAIAKKTPNNLDLETLIFCIPFTYLPTAEQTGLSFIFVSLKLAFNSDFCSDQYTEEELAKMQSFHLKKIKSINGMDVNAYLEDLASKYYSLHSPQANYVKIINSIYALQIMVYPFKKEELNLKIEFEEEILETSYKFQKLNFFSSEFKEYFLKENDKFFKKGIPIQNFIELEKKFKLEKGLLNKRDLAEEDIWDLKTADNNLKCRVDETNKLNILLQKSFNHSDFYDYENTMYECFSKFYSNDFKIVVIESRNGGGDSNLCVPFSLLMNPKNTNPITGYMKTTNIVKKLFFDSDVNLNPETCKSITEADKDVFEGEIDDYGNNILHKRTKDFEILNIFIKKKVEAKRKEYLSGKTKKPTEIIIYTDGYSFSCTSMFIKYMQITGSAIIVGYNSSPGLFGTKFDASQSNSAVDSFSFSNQTQNLEKLGFNIRTTFIEQFDPNDKNNPKIPMEFKIYPVDLVSRIIQPYDDSLLDYFVKESQSIFQQFNNLEGICNPNNTLLYYETSDCDSMINIEHAHGGYICNSQGKWDTTKCIAAYCDEGYILNNEKTQCIKDPCQKYNLQNITIKEENETEYIIEPDNVYIFTIENKNSNYTFKTNIERLLFTYYGNDHTLKPVNSTLFKNGDQIYVNFYMNITKNVTIKVKPGNEEEPIPYDPDNKSDDKSTGLSKELKIIIIVSSIVVLIIIIIILIICIRKKKEESSSDLDEKTKELNPFEN